MHKNEELKANDERCYNSNKINENTSNKQENMKCPYMDYDPNMGFTPWMYCEPWENNMPWSNSMTNMMPYTNSMPNMTPSKRDEDDMDRELEEEWRRNPPRPYPYNPGMHFYHHHIHHHYHHHYFHPYPMRPYRFD